MIKPNSINKKQRDSNTRLILLEGNFIECIKKSIKEIPELTTNEVLKVLNDRVLYLINQGLKADNK